MDGTLLVALLIFAIFIAGAALMISRKLPALLALPLMGVSIALGTWAVQAAGLMPEGMAHISFLNDVLRGVLAKGASRLADPIIAGFFGGMLSFIMQKSGVAENIVKHGAELIGDNPLAVAFFSMLLIAGIFTTIGGLGAVIMVAIVVLPMLATVGVPPVVAGGIMLIGLSMGGLMNPQNWVIYTGVLQLPQSDVKLFATMMFVALGFTGLVFIIVELMRARALRSIKQAAVALIAGAVAAALVIGWIVFSQAKAAAASGTPLWLKALRWGFGGILFLLVGAIVIDLFMRVKHWRQQIVTVKWWAYATPLVPLGLILIFGMDVNAALAVGFVYGILATLRPGSRSLAVQSMIQGSATVLPAALLMVGIGILLNALMGPADFATDSWPVTVAMKPLLKFATPKSPLMYVVIFGVCAPLALYRGPLNTYGMGFGVAALFLQSGEFAPAALMAMLISVGQVQGICDPTNTQNVWLANELRVDVQSLTWRTLPYVWVLVFVGLALGAFMYFR